MTQEDLGARAGYGAGAGVSISRVEKGSTRPTPEKLAGIAEALATTVEQLEEEAAALDLSSSAADADQEAAGDAQGRRASKETNRQLARRLELIVEHRTKAVNAAGEVLNAAHTTARDEFFMNYVEIATQIDGSPQPPAGSLDSEGDATAADQADFRLKTASNMVGGILAGALAGGTVGALAGGAAAYTTFVAASTFGTASTGAAISGLSGAAASNAALAALGGGSLAAGGAGVAGGTALLAGIVAAPIAILGVGGLIWMVRRTRKQEAELRAKLRELEAELEATRSGFEAAVDVINRSAAILDYIGVHAGHAVTKWAHQLELPAAWSNLSPDEQERFVAFNTIAACQVAIVTVDITNFVTLRGDSLDQLIEVTDEMLTQARHEVELLV
jgi:transcriptional regulator with XRE-family HTH domain